MDASLALRLELLKFLINFKIKFMNWEFISLLATLEC